MNIQQLTDYVQLNSEEVVNEEEVKEAVRAVMEEEHIAPTIEYSEWFAFQVINNLK